jgi:hypothetical protein
MAEKEERRKKGRNHRQLWPIASLSELATFVKEDELGVAFWQWICIAGLRFGMPNSEKQSWEKVRAMGRDHFILRSVVRGGWFFVGGIVVEFVWWLFTKKVPDPLLAAVAKWALVAVGMGALTGWQEWNAKEKAYLESKAEAGN